MQSCGWRAFQAASVVIIVVLTVLLSLNTSPALVRLFADPKDARSELNEVFFRLERLRDQPIKLRRAIYRSVAGRDNGVIGPVSVESFVGSRCSNVAAIFENLIATSSLRHWNQGPLTQQQISGNWRTIIYIKNNQQYLSSNAERTRLTPVYFRLIAHICSLVQLPDLVLPINPADEPFSPLDKPQFLLGYCRDNRSSDILLPDLQRGDIFTANKKVASYRSRAGPNDPRRPAAVWRGSMGGSGGMDKGRMALMNLSRERPDLVDAGTLDWDEARFGPPDGRVKPYVSFANQIDTYKYLLWVPGNCAAVRLAAQLLSDAAVMMVESPEIEWFQPLLRPWQHFIPVPFDGQNVGIQEAINWAEGNPEEVAAIVARATAFAQRFLTAAAIDCYVVQLLRAVAKLMPANLTLPADAVAEPFGVDGKARG